MDSKGNLSPWILKRINSDEVIHLKFGRNSIGRSPPNHIHIDSTLVSRRHCELFVGKEKVHLKDFSSNGVYVNKTAYINSETDLEDGDRIGIGCEYDEDEDGQVVDNSKYYIYYLQFKSSDKKSDVHQNNKTCKSHKEEVIENAKENVKEDCVDKSPIIDDKKSDEMKPCVKKEVFSNLRNKIEENCNISKPSVKAKVENVNNICSDEDEDHISMQLSQLIKYDIKQEIIDLDYDDVIVIDDGDSDKCNKEQQIRENELKEDSINKFNEKIDGSPIFIISDDENDDDDPVLQNWIQKLSQSQTILQVQEEKEQDDEWCRGYEKKLQNQLEKEFLIDKDFERLRDEKESFQQNVEKQKQISEHNIEKQNEKDQSKNHKHHPTPRKLLEIIQPPTLPIKKGKLRGVSATSTPENPLMKRAKELKQSMISKIKQSEQERDLRRKWLTKPVNEQKAKKNQIKEARKHKLKELAESNKRKLEEKNDDDDDLKIVKRPKVKVTKKNRGAFLTEETPLPKSSISSSVTSTSTAVAVTPKPHSFEKTLIKLDKETIKHKKTHSTAPKNEKRSEKKPINSMNTTIVTAKPLFRRSSVYDDQSKVNGIEESENLQRRFSMNVENSSNKLNSIQNSVLQSSSSINHSALKPCLKLPTSIRNVKDLHVHFNDKPKIRYIETTINNTGTKLNSGIKDAPAPDMMQILQRQQCHQQQQRNHLPLIDHFDEILYEVLQWKPCWLEKSIHDIIPTNQLLPTLHEYSSFEDYKRILFPLMKLELWAEIEQDFLNHQVLPFHDLKISNHYINSSRNLLIVELMYFPNKVNEPLPFNHGDLCIIKPKPGDQYFAYLRFIKKVSFPNPHYAITFDTIITSTLNHHLNNVNNGIKIKSISQIRLNLGAFNAVYSLKFSPLLKNILNPSENLKTITKIDSQLINRIRYRGPDKLNSNQYEILMRTYLRSINKDESNITLIEGPPGTGKSLVITNLTLQLLYGTEISKNYRRKILICSQSNTAIDVICCRLLHIRKKMITEKFNLLRYGSVDRMHNDVKCISPRYLMKRDFRRKHENNNSPLNKEKAILEAKIETLKKSQIRNNVNYDELQNLIKRLQRIEQIQNNQIAPEIEFKECKRYIEGAHIVCTTLSSATALLRYTKYFDICIIDEATQCTEYLSLIPLQFNISSLILVGDTQQLPATVTSTNAKTFGLDRSLFTRIQNCVQSNQQNLNNNNSIVFTLIEQYRMHPEISHWPNSYFYNNRLINAEITKKDVNLKPYCLFNLSEFDQNLNERNGKIFNTLEAKFVVEFIQHLTNHTVSKHYKYGIITPYAEQRDILLKKLREKEIKEVQVNTIDSYQGKEMDVILISLARTKGVGFLAHPQRLNVALTRARKCLILCGNFQNVERIPAWRSLIKDAKVRHNFFNITNEDAKDVKNKVLCHIIKT